MEQQQQNEEVQQYTELVRDFLDPAHFYRSVRNIGIDFFCGVPDSLLKNFCAYVTAHTDRRKHIITANEGTAVALAAGYHMATKKFAMVYLQVNSTVTWCSTCTTYCRGFVVEFWFGKLHQSVDIIDAPSSVQPAHVVAGWLERRAWEER